MGEVIFSSRVFKIVRQFVVGRSGRHSERHIVVHPGAVVILPVLSDGRVVLIRQHRVAVESELIELPAGTMEPKEEPIITARRELIEETGYSAESLTHIMTFLSSPGFVKEEMHLFLAEGLIAGPTAMEDEEKIETIITSLDDALKMISKGEIRDAKTIIGLYWLNNNQPKN
ncbi:MAG: NUDIX hydrolase [Planctomycetaceae bacterium]|nr:NUDIX hydrolase [Planctomycetaceae bacterium]